MKELEEKMHHLDKAIKKLQMTPPSEDLLLKKRPMILKEFFDCSEEEAIDWTEKIVKRSGMPPRQKIFCKHEFTNMIWLSKQYFFLL